MKVVAVLLSCTICHVLSNGIKQDEAQDRFVDLSVDVSYGLPQLGYVYNGLHLRGPRSRDARKARQGFSHHVQHPDQGASFQSHHGNADHPIKIKPDLDFDEEFETLRSKIKRNPSPELPGVKVVVDSDFDGENQNISDDINLLIEETPGESFVGPRDTEYEAPEISYEGPTYAPPEANYETPEVTYEEPEPLYYPPPTSGPEQYSKPPYVAPSNIEPNYHQPPQPSYGNTKPPLHIKIQQDLQGLVGSMKSVFNTKGKNLPKRENEPYSPKPSKPSSALPPLTIKLPKTPHGKPPLMEKIRQDFFSWLPSSGSSTSSYAAPEQTYNPPAAEYSPTPTPEHYAAPDPGYNVPRQSGPREPLLNKFVRDINKVNTWIAEQTINMASNPPSNPLAELGSGLLNLNRRRDKQVLQYIPAPNLSQTTSQE